MLYGNIPVFTYHIAYPSFSTTCVLSAAQTANIYYMQLAENTEQYCRTVLYPQAVESARYITSNHPPFNRYTLDMNYQITYNSGCITSLYMDTYTYMGGAHQELERISDTWDFSTGKQLHLDDISALTPAALNGLQTSVERQIAERLKESPGSYFEDYPYLSMIASNLKNPEQYKEFVLALQEVLVRLAIKQDSCLVAEKDGRIVAETSLSGAVLAQYQKSAGILLSDAGLSNDYKEVICLAILRTCPFCIHARLLHCRR